MITHVVAMGLNNAIGKDNQLPWYLPEDLKHFKETTMGKTIVMGSNTFRSIVEYANGKPILPGRNIIVICSSPITVSKLNDTIPQPNGIAYWTKAVLDMHIKSNSGSDIFIVGGSKLYSTYKPDKIIATLVDVEVEEADAFYPWVLEDYILESAPYNDVSKTGIKFSYNTYIKT